MLSQEPKPWIPTDPSLTEGPGLPGELAERRAGLGTYLLCQKEGSAPKAAAMGVCRGRGPTEELPGAHAGIREENGREPHWIMTRRAVEWCVGGEKTDLHRIPDHIEASCHGVECDSHPRWVCTVTSFPKVSVQGTGQTPDRGDS